MAGDNKTMGRFDLVGIPAAPRGVPQIEVTFDIDANGIVHVSAKDLGTGKEQSIQVTASSGLSDDEIDKMVKDAEQHAEEDKGKRALIEERNKLDGVVYSAENSLKEYGDKLSEAERTEIEEAVAEAKTLLEDSEDVAALQAAHEKVTTASHALAKQVYENAAAGSGDDSSGAESQAEPDSESADADDVVDADFEEVK
jgi:molecular chaperone DnaK